MINNEEQIQQYENYNKIYIPEDFINENNKYTINNDTLTIITNNNCTTNYNTTNCDCYNYNIKYNVIGKVYSCNRNPNNNNLIDKEYISQDINNSNKIVEKYTQDYIIVYGIIIIALLFISIMKRNSRKI